MLIIPAFVDKSPLHGFGVYAKEFVPAGTKVWERHPIFDIYVSREDFDALPPSVREEVEIHMYVPEADGPYYYETTCGKYMNHSSDPNTDFAEVNVGYALRDVQAGEELTCDYRQIHHDCSHFEYL